eukprot:628393-Hanusia_phi.AAC.2
MPRRRQRRYSRRTVNLRSMKERLVAAEDAARLAPPAGRAEIQRDLRELRLAYDVAKMSANAERENKREVGEMRRDASQVMIVPCLFLMNLRLLDKVARDVLHSMRGNLTSLCVSPP